MTNGPVILGRWDGAPGWRAAARETNKDTDGRWY